MNLKNIDRIVGRIQQDFKVKSGKKLIICLNRSCDSMLEDAFLLTADGTLHNVPYEVNTCGPKADEAVIRMPEGEDDLVAFHETRLNSETHRINGITVHRDPDKMKIPCAIFVNVGAERLTVEGEWVKPGSYKAVYPEPKLNLDDPEVQKAMKEFMSSPEVQEEIEEVRREVAKKRRRM